MAALWLSLAMIAASFEPGRAGKATWFAFAGLIIREILRPDLDVVRSDGSDDPAGGVSPMKGIRRGAGRGGVHRHGAEPVGEAHARRSEPDLIRMERHPGAVGAGAPPP